MVALNCLEAIYFARAMMYGTEVGFEAAPDPTVARRAGICCTWGPTLRFGSLKERSCV